MLSVLLESRARPPKRAGGAALSVAVHLAILGAVTAAAAHGRVVPRRTERPAYMRLTVPRQVAPERALSDPLPTTRRRMGFAAPRIDIPTSKLSFAIDVEPRLSAPAWPVTPTCITCRGGVQNMTDAMMRGGGGAAPAESTEWRGGELLMRIVASTVPRYPERLRDAGVEGNVM